MFLFDFQRFFTFLSTTLCSSFSFVFRTCFITLVFTSCYIFIIVVLCKIQCLVLPNFSSMFQNVPWKFELLMAFFGMLNLACQVVSCFFDSPIPNTFQTLGLALGQSSENFVIHKQYDVLQVENPTHFMCMK